MTMTRFLMSFSALALLAACSTFDPVIKTGHDGTFNHDIQVVEDTVVLEVPMSNAESGIPYYQRKKVQAFLADYKSRGVRHGPLILSVPLGSPWGQQLKTGVDQTVQLAYEYGVQDLKRSDYESNGSPEAPMVLAFTAYRAIAPNCPSLASIDMTASASNDTTPAFGCAMQANLAAMIADPADLIGARPFDAADTLRRVDVLTKYRAGQSTATERAESESGAISQAVQ